MPNGRCLRLRAAAHRRRGFVYIWAWGARGRSPHPSSAAALQHPRLWKWTGRKLEYSTPLPPLLIRGPRLADRPKLIKNWGRRNWHFGSVDELSALCVGTQGYHDVVPFPTREIAIDYVSGLGLIFPERRPHGIAFIPRGNFVLIF